MAEAEASAGTLARPEAGARQVEGEIEPRAQSGPSCCVALEGTTEKTGTRITLANRPLKNNPHGGICQLPWCKHFLHGQFQAPSCF